MTDAEMQAIAPIIAEQIGNYVTPIIALIHGLRQQPGFDDESFKRTVREMADSRARNDIQRDIFLAAIGESQNKPI